MDVLDGVLFSTKKTYAQRTTLEDGLGLSQISTVQVDHSGPNCFGLVITHKDGWKIAFVSFFYSSFNASSVGSLLTIQV